MNKPFLIAIGEFGEKGILGAAHNAKIVSYFKESGFKWVNDDETAWCAAFVNWTLWKAGLKGTGSLAARSFLSYGQPTLTPRIGDIVVLWRISKDSAYGHVGYYFTEHKNSILILGGNQSNAVNVTAFPKSQLLGYRTFSDKK
jgi:uncharacterized protein (TIGR02594 family)